MQQHHGGAMSTGHFYSIGCQADMTADQISEYFGTKKSTVSNKAREIKDMFDMWHFSPEYSTQKMTESNPFNQMVMVDGFIVPIDTIPDHLQQMVRDARARGEDIEFQSK
jgi:hypothetical protein